LAWPAAAGGADAGRVVIEAAEIEAAKVARVFELLNRVPGVSASTSSVSIHGSYKVKVFLDGASITDPSSGFNAVAWDHLSPESLARVEIILDAGGLIYGQDASAGVVLLTSKSADKLSGGLKLYGGDYGLFRAEADLAVASGPWGIAAQAGREEHGGYWPNEDKLIYRGSLKISRRLEEGSVSLAGSLIDDERGLFGYPAYPTPKARKRSQLFQVGQETKWRRLTNVLSYQRGQVANVDPSRGLSQSLTVAEAKEDLSVALKPTGWLDLTLGGGGKKGWAESSDFGQKSEHSLHAFFRAEAKTPIAGLSVSVGARFDYNSAFKNNLNPEASLAYAKGPLTLGLKYGRAANAPSYQQRYNRSSSTEPNPGLDLEIADNYGLSGTYKFSQRLSVRLNLFHNRLKGRITYDRPANSGVGQYKNLGRVVVEGGDLGLDWEIAKFLALKANLTYARAKDLELNKTLPGRSRLSGSSELAFRPTAGFSAILKVDYRSRAWEDRNNTSNIPGYALYGIRAEWDLGQFSLSFSLENALNRDWLYSDGLYGPPAHFRLGLAWRF
jgi:iron complex outermembrane receptor protein